MDILPRVNASGIYTIVNLLDGKLYIGSAKDIRDRWSEHRNDLRDRIHHCKPLQHAFAKYGADVFVFRVIEYCDLEHCVHREQFWMDRTECYDRGKGYNIRAFAWSAFGYVATAETRAKISVASRGRTCSPETREKLRRAFKGRKLSPDLAEKLHAGNRGRTKSQEEIRRASDARRGQKRTPEQRARMSAAYVKRDISPEGMARRAAGVKPAMQDPVVREKIAAGQRGRKLSPERIAQRTATRRKNAEARGKSY